MIKPVRALAALLALFLVLIFADPVRADVGLQPSQQGSLLRTVPYSIPGVFVQPIGAGTGTTTPSTFAAGMRGVIMSAAIASQTGITQTTSLAAMPYPCRPQVYILEDLGAAASWAGVVITINGTEIGGRELNYTMAAFTLNETPTTIPIVFETIRRITMHGTLAPVNASSGDRVVVTASSQIGLPLPVFAATDVLSICSRTGSVMPAAASPIRAERCIRPTTCTGSYNGDPTLSYLSLTTCTFAGADIAFATGQAVDLRYRTPVTRAANVP